MKISPPLEVSMSTVVGNVLDLARNGEHWDDYVSIPVQTPREDEYEVIQKLHGTLFHKNGEKP